MGKKHPILSNKKGLPKQTSDYIEGKTLIFQPAT